MKAGQYFSLIIGISLFTLGVWGVITGFTQDAEACSKFSDAYGINFGYVAGVIPSNGVLNFIRIILGLSGIAASIALDGARSYSRALAVFYGLFAVLGVIPFVNTLFGTVPIFGANVLLHAATAAIAFYYGFIDSPGILTLSSNPQETP